jgi:hypothetical protein
LNVWNSELRGTTEPKRKRLTVKAYYGDPK